MLNLILAVVLLSIFLLIVAETVLVRFTYTDEAVIKIDFLLFQIILYPSRRKSERKRNRLAFVDRLKKGAIAAASTKRAIEFLLKYSTLTIHEINIPINPHDPAKFALRAQNISSLILVLLTYLSLKTETLTSKDDAFLSNDINTLYSIPTIDVTLKTSLHTVILTFLLYYIKKKKRKRKQVQRVVGNKNE